MFSWVTKGNQPEQPPMGVNLPADNKVALVEFKQIADKYKARSEQIDRHIKKASKDRELANKLASSFIHNYYVMIDISTLLNQYAEFFQSIKEMLSKSDVQLEQLNAQNFQNLERLTRQEMDKFTNQFSEQANKVKKLFETYNMTEQAAKLSAVPQFTSQVGIAADEAILATPPKSGGKNHLRKQRAKNNNGRKQEKKGAKA